MTLALWAACAGCRNTGKTANGRSGINPFDGNPRDPSKTVSGDPADDPFLKEAKPPLARLDAQDKKRSGADGSVLDEASVQEPPDREKKSVAPVKTSRRDPKQPESDTEKYKALRARLDAMKAKLSVETTEDGSYDVEAEVPNPKDAELVQVFKSTSKRELEALKAVTIEAEKWYSRFHQKVDDREGARADPFER
jgi:hypothetical protein